MKSLRTGITLAALLCTLGAPAWGQALDATLVGTATDPMQAAIGHGSVDLVNLETGARQSRALAADGSFTLTHLPPGAYELKIEVDGFRTFVASPVTLEPDAVRRVDAHMQLGTVSDVVTVQATAASINTDTPAKATLLDEVFVQTLPLNGRNYLDLAYLAPGVYRRVGSDGDGMAANGTRWDATGFALDGVVNRSDRNGNSGAAISLDAVREFDVQTSTYAAEYGRNAGAQINVVSKSGTNRLSGSLSDYFRNDRFDARNAFAPPGEPATLERQQAAATVGGPIRRDRTFFFASYERVHQKQDQFATSTAPSASWLTGDFHNVRGAGADGIWGNADDTNRIVNPFTRQEFPTPNVIPASMLDPTARQIAAFVPAANVAGTLDGYSASGRALDDRSEYLFKLVDQTFASTTLSARWAHSGIDGTDPFPSQRVYYPGFSNVTGQRSDSVAMSAVSRIGARLVHEARLGYFQQHVTTTGQQASTNYVGEFGLAGLSQDPSVWGFPNIRIDGFSEFGDRPNNPSDYDLRTVQLIDTLTWIRGRHTAKFGADIVQSQYDEQDLRSVRGDFRFRGRSTNPGSGTSSGFRSFADFMLGLVDQSQRQNGIEPARLTAWQTALFVQDDWRVRPSLTLSLGLRYDRQTPLTEANNRLANFIPSLGAVVLAGAPGFPPSLVSTDNGNLAPRVGWAWRPNGDERTVVRGGGGIFYSLEAMNVARQQLGVSYPFVQREQFARTTSPSSLTFANPFPSGLGAMQGVNAPLGMAVDYHTPEYYEYNVTVERELRPGLAAEIGYVGSQGRFLGRRYNLNQPIPLGLLPDGTLSTVRPYPQFADIQYQDQTVSSNYNALQVTVRRRAAKGVALLASYTLAKSIDTGSNSAGNLSNVSTTGAQKAPQDIYNIAAERALSDWDRRHQFSGAMSWDLPFGRGKRWAPTGAVGALAADWQISAIVTLLSGRPYTPQYSAGDFATQRPDLVSDPLSNVPSGLLFNPNAFARPVATAADPNLYGNAGRNILTGPSYQTVDAAIARMLPIAGHATLQFRLEAFNVLNRTNYDVPVFLLDASNVGRVTATAGDARQMQFAVRLTF